LRFGLWGLSFMSKGIVSKTLHSSIPFQASHKGERESSRVTTGGLNQNRRAHVALFTRARKDKRLAIKRLDTRSSLIDDHRDSVLAVSVEEVLADGTCALRSTDLFVKAKGEDCK
jgi:hypothetical protein